MVVGVLQEMGYLAELLIDYHVEHDLRAFVFTTEVMQNTVRSKAKGVYR
jgi:hypothetical protein